MSVTTGNSYETVYILRSGVSDSGASTIHQKIDAVISKFNGKLVHRDDWGNRQLGYPIDDETNGRYVVIGYNGTGGVVEEIERHFKISEDVIRYLTVVVEPEYDYSKIKKQIHHAEEEQKKNREAREQRKKFQQ